MWESPHATYARRVDTQAPFSTSLALSFVNNLHSSILMYYLKNETLHKHYLGELYLYTDTFRMRINDSF